MGYGDRVKNYRELRKMTQESLAEQTGIVASSISKIEHGTRKVTLDEAVLLAQALQVRLDDLAGVVQEGEQQVDQFAAILAQAQRISPDAWEAMERIHALAKTHATTAISSISTSKHVYLPCYATF